MENCWRTIMALTGTSTRLAKESSWQLGRLNIELGSVLASWPLRWERFSQPEHRDARNSVGNVVARLEEIA